MFWKMGVLGILKRNKITQGVGMPVGAFLYDCRIEACGFAREWAPLRVLFEDFA